MLEGSTILITGASSGIGRCFAEALVHRAACLVLVARRAARLRDLAEGLRAANPRLDLRVLPADLADPSAVDALVDALDVDVDVLINNAGLGDLGLFEDADPDALHDMLMVNVVGLVRLTRALLPGMVARGRGAVLNVSSGYGLTWMPGAAAYVGSKHFVTAFTEALRLEVAPAGVVVSQVCPGPVDTEFEDKAGTFFQGARPPRALFLTPQRVVEEALAGLERRRALVIPGAMPKLYVRLGAWTPRAVARLVWRPFAAMLRVEHARGRDGA